MFHNERHSSPRGQTHQLLPKASTKHTRTLCLSLTHTYTYTNTRSSTLSSDLAHLLRHLPQSLGPSDILGDRLYTPTRSSSAYWWRWCQDRPHLRDMPPCPTPFLSPSSSWDGASIASHTTTTTTIYMVTSKGGRGSEGRSRRLYALRLLAEK